METIIYVKLLDEGTIVYRPVPAIKAATNLFEIRGSEIYDPENEIWEFSPGTYVLVEEKNLSGKKVLVAIKEKTSR